MIILPEYEIIRQIYHGERHLLYRAVHKSTGEKVIIKTMSSDFPVAADIARLKREYEIGHMLDIPGIVKPLSLPKYHNSVALVMEDFEGETLSTYFSLFQQSFQAFLQAAIQLAKIVGEVHQRFIIHKDIKPSNIIMNRAKQIMKLGDFSISSFMRERQEMLDPLMLEGTLSYMSPEQTGRMNRIIDYRTDYYSLGVTFYEMITGRLPFQSEDPLELLHGHFAVTPIPPDSVRKGIPKPVSDIIMKLLSKDAEDRYQSAYGIIQDLEQVMLYSNSGEDMSDFKVGRYDMTDMFQIPQGLYGRSAEINKLLNVYTNAVHGSLETVWVTGESGYGKSFLIAETMKTIMKDDGWFLSGRFEPNKHHVSYHAIAKALRALVRQLLTSKDEQLAEYRLRLLRVLGTNGKVLIDLVPELELLIGEQPAVKSLPPQETQNRLHFLLQQFLLIFCAKDRPIVLFLDDLQWADAASLQVLDLLLNDSQLKYFLFIGSYRSEYEKNSLSSMYVQLLDRLPARLVEERIVLKALGLQDVEQLIAESLKSELGQVGDLAKLVLLKTGGNPFFVKQFLSALHEQALLQFNYEMNRWQWDMNEIQKLRITDNLMFLLAEKLERMPAKTQHVLRLASCLGASFDLEALGIIMQLPFADALQELEGAIQNGLIIPVGMDYKFYHESMGKLVAREIRFIFVHDSIQEAIYGSVDESKLKEMHRGIGQMLLSELSEEDIELRLFEIVNHLNIGSKLITEHSSYLQLLDYNVSAGRKAKASNAYRSALQYYNKALDVLKQIKGMELDELSYAIRLEKSEVLYLNGQADEAEASYEQLLLEAKTMEQKLELYNLQVILYTNVGKQHQSVKLGLKVLAEQGIRIPEAPLSASIFMAYLDVKRKIGLRNTLQLYDLPIMEDNYRTKLMNLMMSVAISAYFVNTNLYVLFMLNMTKLALEFGNSPAMAYVYGSYGLILGSGFGDYQRGYLYGQLGNRMNERFQSHEFQSKSYFSFGLFVTPWVKPLPNSLELLKDSFRSGIEDGDLVFAGYALTYQVLVKDLQGVVLSEVYEDLVRNYRILEQTNHHDTLLMMEMLRLVILNLEGKTLNPLLIGNDEVEEKEFVRKLEVHSNQVIIHVYSVKKMMLSFLFGHYEDAVEMGRTAESRQSASFGLFHMPENYLYFVLSIAAQYPEASLSDRKWFAKQVKKMLRKMDKWASHCPENFLHLSQLMRAEWDRVTGHGQQAEQGYENAIRQAREQGFIQHEAIASELAGKYYKQAGREKIAKTYLIDAYYGYVSWGARAKADHLVLKYPTYFSNLSGSPDWATTKISDYSLQAIDFQTIMNTSRSLSSEVNLEQLIKRLMEIVTYSSGAERSILVLKDKESLYVEAEMLASAGKDSCIVSSVLLESRDNVPQAVIQYVARMKEGIVLDDAENSTLFANDLYIKQSESKSIFCEPILHQGNLVGVFYLENNLIRNAFTSERLDVIKLLSAQAAISIENARLYNDLESKVKERTNELILMETSRRDLLSNISHDLGTPLTSIQGYVEAILDGVIHEPEEQKKYLSVVHMRIVGIQRLIMDLYQLSRLETKQFHFRLASTSCASAVRQLFAKYELDATNAGITYTLNMALMNGQEMLTVDMDRIEQVYANLIYNAIKFSSSGCAIDVHVEIREEPYELVIRVCDTGVGISEEDLPHIFERFYKVSKSRSNSGGSGLGLAIAKEIVQYHGGQIWAESRLGHGCTISFSLPLHRI
ncbi:AAA family ATPase [Paenibacillus qinlingensis]|uniref:histidine kinase n=1 Tax=Paenibacillus qinlingensis TaxID=1837343 RepID=A0ABU1NUQ1_9BACL|nr:AAA family ATPase [Paenibacillus qinlingensis]MDR6551201.1 putative ATPase/signal transduction histidine kinase/tRNA A-37 threonylcarbamoyl transferase component Bud32 [Paenibacillus qinlingensis]